MGAKASQGAKSRPLQEGEPSITGAKAKEEAKGHHRLPRSREGAEFHKEAPTEGYLRRKKRDWIEENNLYTLYLGNAPTTRIYHQYSGR